MFSGSDSIKRPATSNVVHRTLNAHRDCAPLPDLGPQTAHHRPQTADLRPGPQTWTASTDRSFCCRIVDALLDNVGEDRVLTSGAFVLPPVS